MKISVLQENLNKAVSAVARTTASNPQLPVLSNILFRAEEGKLVVVGTDLTTSVGLVIGGKVEKEGAITVPARDMAALTGSLPADKVELIVKDSKLEVKCGSTKANLIGISAEEFPDVDEKGKDGFSLSIADFSMAVGRTQFCVSSDEMRPVLTGVMISKENGKLRFQATDGYRLSIVELVGVSGSLNNPIVVSGRTLAEVHRLVSSLGGEHEDKKVKIKLTEGGGVSFEFDGGWVSGKLLAGKFPSVEQILPKEADTVVTIDRGELEKAIRVAAIFARESANIVRWKISAKGGSASGRENNLLIISANSPQIGENETIVEIDGKGMGEIAFNSRYLLDLLGSVSDEERIQFEMSGPLKPGLFSLVKKELYRHVVMPVRVQK